MTARRRLALLGFLALCLPGCALLSQLLGSAVQQPVLTFKAVNVREPSLDGVTLDVVYHVDNPNPVGISLAEIDYALAIEGKPVVSGNPPNGLTLPASGGADLTFPATVKFADLASTVEVFLTRDTAHYRVSGHAGIQTPVGVVTVPLDHEGDFPVPKLPSVQLGPPRITGADLAGLTLEVPLTVTNRNDFTLPVSGVSGNLTVGGATVASVATGDLGGLAPRSPREIRVPVTLSFLGAAEAIQAIKSGQADFGLHGQLGAGGHNVPLDLAEHLAVAH